MNNITVYSLNISKKFKTKEEIYKELKNLYQLLKRYKKINTFYKNISFMIGISNKSSIDAKVVIIHNKSRGKPRKKVVGTEVGWHFHIYIIGYADSSVASFSNSVRIYISKKKGYRTSLNKNTNINNALNYVNKQCISVWKHGDYFHSKN